MPYRSAPSRRTIYRERTSPTIRLTPTVSQPQSTLLTNRSPRPAGGECSSAVVYAIECHLILPKGGGAARKWSRIVEAHREVGQAFRLPEGRVAQLVRAPASHAGGHRFESCRAHHFSDGPSYLMPVALFAPARQGRSLPAAAESLPRMVSRCSDSRLLPAPRDASIRREHSPT